MHTAKFTYTNYLGITKEVEHTEEEAKVMAEMPDIAKRCQRICEQYACKGYWTHYFIDGVEVAHAQNADY